MNKLFLSFGILLIDEHHLTIPEVDDGILVILPYRLPVPELCRARIAKNPVTFADPEQNCGFLIIVAHLIHGIFVQINGLKIFPGIECGLSL